MFDPVSVYSKLFAWLRFGVIPLAGLIQAPLGEVTMGKMGETLCYAPCFGLSGFRHPFCVVAMLRVVLCS